MDVAQVRALEEHLAAAAAMDPAIANAVRALAAQLDGLPTLPILGAGASHDCGMRLASQLGEDLYEWYMGNSAFEPHAAGLKPDLA